MNKRQIAKLSKEPRGRYHEDLKQEMADILHISPDDIEDTENHHIIHQVVLVTPQIATEWLNLNKKNRSLVDNRIYRYAHEMESQQWVLAQSVMFGYNGRLIDGQHRLLAIIESNISVLVDVAFGYDPEIVFGKIDGGLARSIADALQQNGEVNCKRLGAVLKMVRADITGLGDPYHLGGKAAITDRIALETLKKYPDIRMFVNSSRPMKIKHGAPAMKCFIYRKMTLLKGKAVADKFFDEVIRCQDENYIPKNEHYPPYRLAVRLKTTRDNVGKRMTIKEQASIFHQAINDFTHARNTKQFRYKNRKGHTLPVPPIT